MKMRKQLYSVFLALSLTLSHSVQARNIASDWVKVVQVRSIISGEVYFVLDKVAMCNTNTLLLRVANDTSKAAYSALLAAATAGKEVKLETWGECAPNGGWGTEVQAVNVKFP